MNAIEKESLFEQLRQLTPEQLEQVFVTLHQRFRYRNRNDKEMDCAALAWRCKQAYTIIQHRKPAPTSNA